MIIGRAQEKGDAIQGVNKMQCDKFSGKWKSDTCHCSDGRTLYTLNNKISCFAGIGENIGEFFTFCVVFLWLFFFCQNGFLVLDSFYLPEIQV